MNPSYVTNLQTSLTLSALLDKAGIKVEMEYKWYQLSDGSYEVWDSTMESEFYSGSQKEICPCYILDELLGILPENVEVYRYEEDNFKCYFCRWFVGGDITKYKHLEQAETAVEACAKMLIYLLEQGIIK